MDYRFCFVEVLYVNRGMLVLFDIYTLAAKLLCQSCLTGTDRRRSGCTCVVCSRTFSIRLDYQFVGPALRNLHCALVLVPHDAANILAPRGLFTPTGATTEPATGLQAGLPCGEVASMYLATVRGLRSPADFNLWDMMSCFNLQAGPDKNFERVGHTLVRRYLHTYLMQPGMTARLAPDLMRAKSLVCSTFSPYAQTPGSVGNVERLDSGFYTLFSA